MRMMNRSGSVTKMNYHKITLRFYAVCSNFLFISTLNRACIIIRLLAPYKNLTYLCESKLWLVSIMWFAVCDVLFTAEQMSQFGPHYCLYNTTHVIFPPPFVSQKNNSGLLPFEVLYYNKFLKWELHTRHYDGIHGSLPYTSLF